jgi:hypothetical protein
MTMAKTETIKIQDGDQVIELTGADKEAFLADREATNVAIQLVEAEQLAKQQKRIDAITKLAEVAGLTKEEIEAII